MLKPVLWLLAGVSMLGAGEAFVAPAGFNALSRSKATAFSAKSSGLVPISRS